MARSIQEIKRSMTAAFVADKHIREQYDLQEQATFEDSFSVVSIESILFFIVAACCYVLECLFDRHVEEVNEKISRAVVASAAWYYKLSRQFQYGDALIFDETTAQYCYAVVDESKQLVRYVAVRDRGTSVQILASGDKEGMPVPLSNDVLTAFKQYMNRVKIAGVVLNISSLPADVLRLYMEIQIDPLILNLSGARSDGTKAVENAIKDYLRNIKFGGNFNKTKLVDAIQAVEGVVDVTLSECVYKTSTADDFHRIIGNNYTSAGGSFIVEGLQNSINYVV